jgi:hypothetical protein
VLEERTTVELDPMTLLGFRVQATLAQAEAEVGRVIGEQRARLLREALIRVGAMVTVVGGMAGVASGTLALHRTVAVELGLPALVGQLALLASALLGIGTLAAAGWGRIESEADHSAPYDVLSTALVTQGALGMTLLAALVTGSLLVGGLVGLLTGGLGTHTARIVRRQSG